MARDVRYLARGLLIGADVMTGLAAAVVLTVGYIAPTTFGSFDADQGSLLLIVRKQPLLTLLFWYALFLLLANGLYFLYGRPPRSPLHHVASETSGGTVKVAREALESGLRTAGEGLPEVTRLRVSVEHGGLKKLRIRAWFHAAEGVAIHEASERLRHVLANRFREMVRLSEGSRVDFEIDFVGFQGKLNKKSEPSTPEQEFTGPRYPIDDEDPFDTRRNA